MSTPLMKQYMQVKARYPDTILLFRMGDFFETFEEDARITARVLGITLTRRGNGTAGEVPLAGFPHHALDAYLPKLLKAGHRVAICEQLEDPKLAKGIVKRDVVEVVTPGVAFSDKVLEQKQNNFLAAVALPHALATGDDRVGLAYVDVSTAEFRVSEFPFRRLQEQLGVLGASELLIQRRDMASLKELLKTAFTGLFTPLEDWILNREYCYDLLTGHFQTQSLKGFGVEDYEAGILAAGAIMNYLQETQKANLPHLRRLVPFDAGSSIVLDPSTKRNLEITASMTGASEGTLFSVLDRTQTPMGGRLLKRWIHQPLNTLEPIVRRLDAVEELTRLTRVRTQLAETLGQIGDLERLTTRICTGRATPRDVVTLRGILLEIGTAREHLRECASAELSTAREGLTPLPDVTGLIERAIAPEPPPSLADGGVIRNGYNVDLDALRNLAFNGKQWISELQRSERERTGIGSLKVGFNNVFGYYIEVTNTHREKVPADYIRKQTLTGAERYVTPALKEQEEKILHAEERMLALETELFDGIRTQIAAHTDAIQKNAQLLAEADCYLSLASAAVEYKYHRPEVNGSSVIEITGGRHPVIERLLPPGEKYTPNDIRLDTAAEQILIITGPNMSGKSSYLRQTGLIVLLAQIGSFVPAAAAVIGLVDRIYTRVGASDNIASGESTFLVEMHEAAHIVNTATARSLILLDEVGRGTSTFDGISIAWSLTEYLHDRVGARTLFATHYHELNELADLFPRVRNYKVDVREYGDRVVFLHKVKPGFADHSYGIEVARLAGLPDEVIARARTILRNLEGSDLIVHGSHAGRVSRSDPQLTLFELKDDALRAALDAVDIERITPLEAMRLLAELKNLRRDQ
jgi:DNA mismatch repair protein MutS